MTAVSFVPGDWNRQVAAEPYFPLVNRFCESNPALNDSPASFIARPALKKWIEVGTGPIHKLFSEPGIFNGDLFVLTGGDFYRVSSDDGADTLIANLGDPPGDPSFAATAPIGDEPAHLFMCAGSSLWLYMDDGHSVGTLTASGAIANNDVIKIDTTYYKWTTGSVDTGTPAGTVGSPWLVALGASNTEALDNMYQAINLTGTAGTTYSTLLTAAHATVVATLVTAATLTVKARVAGPAGDAITTTTTGANIAWGVGTLADGGDPALTQVALPDDIGAISVASINSYVIVIPVQSEDDGTVGRFYWIDPGEITIDPLNFATAERAPDALHQVVVYGDLFWLLGQKTTEPWQTTGNLAAPMARYPGILFDRGSWEGTAVQVKDSLIVIDEDGGVFQIAGGQTRISNPAVEELIRRAIQVAAAAET